MYIYYSISVVLMQFACCECNFFWGCRLCCTVIHEDALLENSKPVNELNMTIVSIFKPVLRRVSSCVGVSRGMVAIARADGDGTLGGAVNRQMMASVVRCRGATDDGFGSPLRLRHSMSSEPLKGPDPSRVRFPSVRQDNRSRPALATQGRRQWRATEFSGSNKVINLTRGRWRFKVLMS